MTGDLQTELFWRIYSSKIWPKATIQKFLFPGPEEMATHQLSFRKPPRRGLMSGHLFLPQGQNLSESDGRIRWCDFLHSVQAERVFSDAL
jgi:hypothetical protein